MGLNIFRSKASRELDEIINALDMNMSNNYKDAAGDDFERLKSAFEEMRGNKKLKDKEETAYAAMIGEYEEKLKGYSHKEQKPYWH